MLGCIALLADTLLADLQSTTTGLRHHCTVTADGNHAVILDSDSHSTMTSRISTDSLDAEGQVSVRPAAVCFVCFSAIILSVN